MKLLKLICALAFVAVAGSAAQAKCPFANASSAALGAPTAFTPATVSSIKAPSVTKSATK